MTEALNHVNKQPEQTPVWINEFLEWNGGIFHTLYPRTHS